MTKEAYLKFHSDFCIKMTEITRKKNHDYTGDSSDPFANFKNVENLNITSTEVGFLTRMTDKMSRINSFVQKGVLLVDDEKIEDSLLDLANYAALMAAYIQDKKRVNSPAVKMPFKVESSGTGSTTVLNNNIPHTLTNTN